LKKSVTHTQGLPADVIRDAWDPAEARSLYISFYTTSQTSLQTCLEANGQSGSAATLPFSSPAVRGDS